MSEDGLRTSPLSCSELVEADDDDDNDEYDATNTTH